MPLYGYKCSTCEHTLDALQKHTDDPLIECPECGKPTLERQISGNHGILFLGYGWTRNGMSAPSKK